MYYSQMLLEKPSDWEATFYSIYFKASTCKLGEMESRAYDLYMFNLTKILYNYKSVIDTAKKAQQLIRILDGKVRSVKININLARGI